MATDMSAPATQSTYRKRSRAQPRVRSRAQPMSRPRWLLRTPRKQVEYSIALESSDGYSDASSYSAGDISNVAREPYVAQVPNVINVIDPFMQVSPSADVIVDDLYPDDVVTASSVEFGDILLCKLHLLDHPNQ